MTLVAVVLVTWILYLGVGLGLLVRGWPLRAGIAMVLIASLPIFWQVIFTDSDAPGFGFLFDVMLVPAAAMILFGLVAALYRRLRRG